MRLWSLHPKYLDPQGLVALWRESLLARAVELIPVNSGQLTCEWLHLQQKLAAWERAASRLERPAKQR